MVPDQVYKRRLRVLDRKTNQYFLTFLKEQIYFDPKEDPKKEDLAIMSNVRMLLFLLPILIASALTLPSLHQRDDDVEYVYWFDYLFLPQHLEEGLAKYFLEVHSTNTSQLWSYECSGGYAQGVYGDKPMQCQMKKGPTQPALTVTISLPHAVSGLPSDENTFFTVRNTIDTA